MATLASGWARALLRCARHAYNAEQHCGAADPAEMRAELNAAIATRTHVDIGRRVRAIDRDNVGHVLSIDDHAGACLVQFDSIDGRTAVKTLDWSELVVIDHPDTAELTPAAAETVARRTNAALTAESEWAAALAEHGVRPGDATTYRRAVHTAADNAARALQADPPEWLTTWLGSRPTAPAAASVWDDATTRIAHHRLLHDIAQDEHGIGTCPADPVEVDRWQDLMLRLLEDRLWLVDHTTPEVVPLPAATPQELVDRRAELERLLATAPADQQQFIDRIVRSELDPTEMHEYLSAAVAVQDERRDWILTNWPHLVELEQVAALIAEQEPLAHWPVTQPAEVRDVLDQLRQLAQPVDTREERSLAELDRLEIESDPVRKLEARSTHLRQLADQAIAIEQEAIKSELARLSHELRAARRTRTLNEAFDRYGSSPIDEVRATRIKTLAHDALTNQPTWIIDEIRSLQENGQLNTRDLAALATRITHAAVHQDRHGHLPDRWIDLSPEAPEPLAHSIEVGR